jgi:DNA-binding CsgD family transcriptional regulator
MMLSREVAMIAVLRLDRKGVVQAASPDAGELLGACVGRRCCDVVVARGSDRTVLCTPDCAALSGDGPVFQELRGVRVRDRVCRVICATAGDGRTVMVLSDRSRRVQGVMLSPRETAALALVASGHPDAEIADALEIAPSTVKTLLARARGKLGARTRAEAVALALRSGLID